MATTSVSYEKEQAGSVMRGRDGMAAPLQLPDLRKVAVLSKKDWLRIRDTLNHVNYHNQSLQEAAEERERLHQRSKEVVKHWSNTIAGQRRKKLEAKKIREEIEENVRKQIDLEEARYQQQMRREALEKARTQRYYETHRVRGFNNALLLTEVLKEREAQIELKKDKQNISEDINKAILEKIKLSQEKAIQKEEQAAEQRRMKNKALAEDLRQQITQQQLGREEEKFKMKKEAEDVQRLREAYKEEKKAYEEKIKEEKRNNMKAHMEHITTRDALKASEMQREKMAEERRKLFAAAKEKMMNLRKEKEAELFREAQRHREDIVDRLAALQLEKACTEHLQETKAIAQREAWLAEEQKQKKEKKEAMLEAITTHRLAMLQEKKARQTQEKQKDLEMLYAKKEADKIFLEKQQQKQQKQKEECKILQDTYIQQMAEKRAKQQLEKQEEMELESKNAHLLAEEEKQFQTYAKGVIEKACEGRRNVYPLQRAARGRRQSYLSQDETGVELPTFVSDTTQAIKGLKETTDIERAKKRLGFTW